MKKVIILALLLALTTGCVNIENSTYDEIINEITSSKRQMANTYRKGYKFYLPQNLYVATSKDFNETIKSQNETFYFYIDLISYLNKNKVEYEREDNIFYKDLTSGEMSGYVEIKNAEKGKYLVEIAYNCAKIEVIVEKGHEKRVISEALIILSSIQYNDSFLTNLSDDSLLNYKEETVDIFDKGTSSDNSNILEWKDEYDGYDEDRIPDWDHIR